jgi:probable rRNA maturation factor
MLITISNNYNFSLPSQEIFTHWAFSTLVHCREEPLQQINLLIVSKKEMYQWNFQYRNQSKVTDVLSFPRWEDYLDPYESIFYLGDIVWCKEYIDEMIEEKKINVHSHYAHIFIHSILHLLGYDHIHRKERKVMENLEEQILKKLGY